MAEEKWIKVEKGIRYREHLTRKHGINRDRYYVLRFATDGKMHQEALGWASEGMTLDKARIELAKLKEAQRTGEGPRSLTERRIIAEDQRRIAEEVALAQARAQITMTDFWEQSYRPAQIHKAPGSRVAEDALWRTWLQPRLGSTSVVALTPAQLDQVKVDMLKAGKAPSSIKYAMAVVSQMWTLALRDDIVSTPCPTKKITLPKKDNRRQRYLSKEEIDQLLAALRERSPLMHDMAVLAVDCGLRFGEIAALTWKDCDFVRGSLHIRDPKARVNRSAFMTMRVKRVLEARSSQKQGPHIFQGGDERLDPGRQQFKDVVDSLFNKDVEDKRYRVCFHTLRHTFASRLVEHGVDLYRVKELMGHSGLRMTERYSHLSPKKFNHALDIRNKE